MRPMIISTLDVIILGHFLICVLGSSPWNPFHMDVVVTSRVWLTQSCVLGGVQTNIVTLFWKTRCNSRSRVISICLCIKCVYLLSFIFYRFWNIKLRNSMTWWFQDHIRPHQNVDHNLLDVYMLLLDLATILFKIWNDCSC